MSIRELLWTLAALALPLAAAGPQPDLKWWYREPAAKYWEALPLSNGRLAAMVYGRPAEELIPLNEETLWSGGPYDPNNPEGRTALPEIRRLLVAGDFVKAQELCEKLLSRPLSVQHYQPLGEARLHFEGADNPTAYRRELDMDSAIVRVSYTSGGVRFQREIFASFPDQVLVVRITADQPGKVSFAAREASIQPSARSARFGPTELGMWGTAETVTEGRSANPVLQAKTRWYSRLRIAPEGGTVKDCRIPGDEERTSACVAVSGANAATIFVTAATSFLNWQDTSGNAESLALARMAAARGSYATLLARHLQDWQPQFRSARLDLGGHEAANEDTTTRLDRLRHGASDPLFAVQYFQFARYLLLAESRPGTLPFNNHNVWLDNMEGRWAGRFTLNINIQECYWPADTTNLPQTLSSLLAFTEDLAKAGARTARELYGARGWVAHHGTDVWLNTAPTDSTGPGIWPTGGAWLVNQLWDHYLFDADVAYLKRLYPLLKGASEFFLDFLMEEPSHGWLVTAPSISPENSFLTPRERVRKQVSMGPTMDNQLLRDLFDHTAEAARILGVDASLREQVQAARKRLPPDRIGKHGQVQEWLEDFDEFEPTHRHLSPLYGFYPSNQITRARDPELVQAVRRTLERRTDKNLGWSGAWKMNLYARLGEGDRAGEILRQMLTEISLHPTKEDSDRVPSFEGNQAIQGVAAGMAEMLLQSHEGEIHLLPALPKAWASGSVSGLRARGGFEVDLAWDGGALTRVRIVSKAGRTCALRYAGKTAKFTTRAGAEYVRNRQLQ